MKSYKVILSDEEMNGVRNGMNLILVGFKNELSDSAKDLYEKIRIRFDMEYEHQKTQ